MQANANVGIVYTALQRQMFAHFMLSFHIYWNVNISVSGASAQFCFSFSFRELKHLLQFVTL